MNILMSTIEKLNIIGRYLFRALRHSKYLSIIGSPLLFNAQAMTSPQFGPGCISLSVEFSTQAPDQNPIFDFSNSVRALFGQRSPAHAANGQF